MVFVSVLVYNDGLGKDQQMSTTAVEAIKILSDLEFAKCDDHDVDVIILTAVTVKCFNLCYIYDD